MNSELPNPEDQKFRFSAESPLAEVTILYSNIFQRYPELRFGFSTKRGGVSRLPYGLNLSFMVGDDPQHVEENRLRFFSKLEIPVESLAVPKQFHGDNIKIVQSPGVYDLCDALITNKPDVFLCVTTADCLPIFIYDPVKKVVCGIHAGWRGTKLKIVEKAIKKMVKEFAVNPSDLVAFIGPAAGVCCYEVGEDVAREFDNRYLVRYSTKKPHLNMKLYTKIQMIDSGMRDRNIEVSDYCTIDTPSMFYSFRREKLNSGRMMGVFGMLSVIPELPQSDEEQTGEQSEEI